MFGHLKVCNAKTRCNMTNLFNDEYSVSEKIAHMQPHGDFTHTVAKDHSIPENDENM